MKQQDIKLLIFHADDPKPITETRDFDASYHRLFADALLVRDYRNGKNGMISSVIEVTERGRVFLNALCTVPLPVQAWTMPGKE